MARNPFSRKEKPEGSTEEDLNTKQTDALLQVLNNLATAINDMPKHTSTTVVEALRRSGVIQAAPAAEREQPAAEPTLPSDEEFENMSNKDLFMHMGTTLAQTFETRFFKPLEGKIDALSSTTRVDGRRQDIRETAGRYPDMVYYKPELESVYRKFADIGAEDAYHLAKSYATPERREEITRQLAAVEEKATQQREERAKGAAEVEEDNPMAGISFFPTPPLGDDESDDMDKDDAAEAAWNSVPGLDKALAGLGGE